jgi:hypothetical protein
MGNYNPYAYTSQQAAPQAAASFVAGAPEPWEVGDVIGHAWRVFKPHWATLVFTQLISGVIGGVPNYIPGVLVATQAVEPNSSTYWTIYGVCLVVGLVFSSFFTGGMIKIWCAASRGQTPQFGDMFAGASRFLPLLGTLFLTLLVVMLGYVALVVPGIILGLGLAFAQCYVVDQNMGPIAAMKASWEATKGHKGKIFLFGLVAFLMALGGYLACCVGVFVALPLIMVAWVTIYTRISGTSGGAGLPPGTFGGPPANYGGPPPGGYSGGPPGYGPPPAGGFGGGPQY